MEYNICKMTSEQIAEFKAKGKWFLAREVYNFDRDDDGDIIDNPNDSIEWNIETIENGDKLFSDKRYLGYREDYGLDTDYCTIAEHGLFDDHDEACEYLKNLYLEHLQAKMNNAEGLIKRVKAEINKVKDRLAEDEYNEPVELKY